MDRPRTVHGYSGVLGSLPQGGASQDNPGTVHDWDTFQQGVYWWSVPGMYSGVLGYFATGGILVDPERPILVKHPRTVHG